MDSEWTVRRAVDKEGDSLSKVIERRLADTQWIDCSSLDDFAVLRQVETEDLYYALAKYAAENPDKIRYGVVVNRKAGALVTSDKVLVNLQNLEKGFRVE